MTDAVAVADVGADGYELSFSDVDGVAHRRPLTLCWQVPFEQASPARPSFKGQSNFPGFWYFASAGEHVGYESWLERDNLMALDADPDVVAVSSQPFWLHWTGENGRSIRHAPDFFVRRSDGLAVVVDVRADGRIEPEDAAKFAATARACDSVGWGYRRVGALEPALAANLRWLSGYRHSRCYQRERAADLRRVFACPTALMDGVTAVGDPLGVLPVLFHLLWRHELDTDLRSAPLCSGSLVWSAGGNG